jgi:hypothetical protein
MNRYGLALFEKRSVISNPGSHQVARRTHAFNRVGAGDYCSRPPSR